MAKRRKRIYGEKIDFKTLSCAPVNELGVVYLFGVLHDTFDLKIESIQASFPDCIARKKIKKNKWEEVKIEFEFESKSFKVHEHDADAVDMIVCWKHNWNECPSNIEIIELSSVLGDAERIDDQIKTKKKLTEWQKFAQEKRLEGLSFTEIAKLWDKSKKKASTLNHTERIDNQQNTRKKLTEWQKFAQKKRIEGLDFKEIGKLWRESKKS